MKHLFVGSLFILFLVFSPVGHAYKVEKPENIPTNPPEYDVFKYIHASREATLISVGEQSKKAEATIGGTLYLAQTHLLYPGYRIKKYFKGLMPGSLGIPFKFWLNQGDLFFNREDTKYLYFAPTSGKSGASFPGLGEVVSGEDSVGVRRHKKSGVLEWFVNNSDFNQSSRHIIWHRRLTKDELQTVDYVPEGLPYKLLGYRKIVYDGYFNNNLIFTLVDTTGDKRSEQEYRVTPDVSGKTIVVIGGIVIQCSNINPSGMTYELLSINEH